MSDTRLSISDDYCVMTVGDLEFYYGYEYGYVVKDAPRDEDECVPYGFYIKRKGEAPLFSASKEEMPAIDEDEMAPWLLGGIALAIERGALKVAEKP